MSTLTYPVCTGKKKWELQSSLAEQITDFFFSATSQSSLRLLLSGFRYSGKIPSEELTLLQFSV